MKQKSCIFWFSGTGNSLYAAKRLSSELDMPLCRITDEPPRSPVGGKGEKVGFVFPSYYGNLPRAVLAFVNSLEIHPDTYVFAVVTMGAMGLGSVGALQSALSTKGVRLSYGRGIRMPANYVIAYNPADTEKSGKAMDRTNGRILRMAAEIAAEKQVIRKFPMVSNNLYSNVEALDAGITAGDGCTGCGLCQRVCPVGNISMEDGRPQWLHRCEHCVACISWCPAKAIEYADKTQRRRRYRNPFIKAEELTERAANPASERPI